LANELAPPAPLTPAAPAASSVFDWADAFTAREEGGKTTNDGTGHAAAYGIDQNAHPEVNVASLSPEQAKEMRRQYWTAIGGDAIAQQNPKLALAAYDTAIMAGPARAKEFLEKSQGSPEAFMQLRSSFLQNLVKSDPQKYAAVAQGWAARDQRLGQELGGQPNTAGGGPGGGDRSLTQFPIGDSFLAKNDQPEQQAAPPPAAAPAAKPLNPQPLGLAPQPLPQVKAPQQMDLYTQLLKKSNPLQGAA